MRTLVLGGIRSGKSCWAEEAIAEAVGREGGSGSQVRYLATASGPAADPDWSARIAEHRDRRPPSWITVESDDVAAALGAAPGTAALVDDVGNWLTGAMDRRDAWTTGSVADEVDDLVAAVSTFGSPLVLVSPEVGLMVVPGSVAGRRFADTLGVLNQRLAAACDRVVLVVAGIPIIVKGPESI
jgi:adenosylcobinamide kinase / adenosylcobinamide-phosphate guanylyltransferase